MDRRIDHLADLLARGHGDFLDGRALGAEHDLLLAVAHHVDGLLDADAAVGELLPGLGLDGEAVGQLLMQPQKQLLARDLGREPGGAAHR